MTMDNQAKNTGVPVTNLMEAMQEAGTKMMPSFGPEWFETMNSVGTEMLSFMSERIKHDIRTQQDLLKAEDIAEVQKIQADFVKKAMEDYTDEMSKLMGMSNTHKKHATPV